MNKPRATEFTTHVRSYGKFGELLERNKVKSTEKTKAALMIERLKELHNISEEDIRLAREKEVKNEIKMLSEISDTKRIKGMTPIVWKRDDMGNIK